MVKKFVYSIVAILMVATGCQKEETVNFSNEIGSPYEMKRIRYSVDGNLFSIEIRGSETWRAFMERMAALAKEGHEVSFWDENATSTAPSTKETVTYTTANEKDAIDWCETMFHDGYKVSMTYDDNNHVFVCIATK